MPGFIPWLSLHFLVAAAGTWLARRYAIHRQLIDQPGDRRSHQVATPRGGGIAIVMALLLAAIVLGVRAPAERELFVAFGIGLLLVAGVGWWDDHRPLPASWRLLVHLLSALVFAAALYRQGTPIWQALLAIVAVLVLVNVWNFMDGIDGLAASQALLTAVAAAFFLHGPWSWLAAALFAACCGFLPFNFPRARIFLGDVGSGALGFTLAALLSLAPGDGTITPWLFMLPPAAFLVDAGFTLATRILRGERWWTPHVSHVYQRAARRYGHVTVTNLYGLFSGVTLLLMWMLSNAGTGLGLVIVAIWYAFALALWGWSRKGLS
ncbi:MraY family glycosyltransferase [Pseudoxanthomonas beigongshangi]